MKDTKKKLGLSISAKVHDRLKEIAYKEERSMNWLVEKAIEAYLKDK